MFTCPKCNGTKVFTEYAHIEHGICFMCNGTGEVDKLPTDPFDESCTRISYMKKAINDTTYHIACFYTWADDGREYANTGHHYIDLVNTQREVDDYYGNGELSYYRTSIVDTVLHQPIDQVRADYKALLIAGYVAVEYSNSLFEAEMY